MKNKLKLKAKCGKKSETKEGNKKLEEEKHESKRNYENRSRKSEPKMF